MTTAIIDGLRERISSAISINQSVGIIPDRPAMDINFLQV